MAIDKNRDISKSSRQSRIDRKCSRFIRIPRRPK